MALKARKSAVENSNLEAELDCRQPLSPDGHIDGKFPISHDTNVTLGKSPSLQILRGVSRKDAWAKVTLIGKNKENKSPAGKIDDRIIPIRPPHLVDCDNLSAMKLRKKYPGEATCNRKMLSARRNWAVPSTLGSASFVISSLA